MNKPDPAVVVTAVQVEEKKEEPKVQVSDLAKARLKSNFSKVCAGWQTRWRDVAVTSDWVLIPSSSYFRINFN